MIVLNELSLVSLLSIVLSSILAIDVCLAKLKSDGLFAVYSTFASTTWNGTVKALSEYKCNGVYIVRISNSTSSVAKKIIVL